MEVYVILNKDTCDSKQFEHLYKILLLDSKGIICLLTKDKPFESVGKVILAF